MNVEIMKYRNPISEDDLKIEFEQNEIDKSILQIELLINYFLDYS